MRQKYEIIRIEETDFGCEELPEDAEVMVQVTLQSEDGTKQKILYSDALLYEKEMNEGDKVFLVDGKLKKAEE